MLANDDGDRSNDAMARRPPTVGEETKAKIVAAALDTLRTQGVGGTSARAIARTGDFNQALIFYHFGSVTELLVAASLRESERRAQRYADALADVTTLPELVQVARLLHDEETQEGNVAVLTQMMAAAAHSDELRRAVLEGFTPWMQLVEGAIERVVGATPYAGLIPTADLAFAISSLFLGVELVSSLDPERGTEQRLFTTIESLTNIVTLLLQLPAPTPAPTP
jgi:AcrR family transcriptional regulator